MTGSARELIRKLRICKSPVEEKAVIARECAEIRSALNGNSNSTRQKIISKLLLIHLMGYSTSFGQVECIKLIASSKFADKRVGYLALNQLLQEDAEVLTLAINSIKMDLSSPNPYVTELALNALASIGNIDMFKELHYDIERLMQSPVVTVRKKAVICAARMLRKLGQMSLIPGPDAIDLAGNYVHVVPSLLVDPNHGVVSAALTVLSALMDYFQMCINYTSIYELLMKTMTALCNEGGNSIGIMFGATNDYEINGVNDPFLKSKLLQLIRKVYEKCRGQITGNQQYFDLINSIVKSATQTNNATNSLLYECARSIYCEINDPKFNQLGKDIVQKFMASHDNNIKYIALGILNNLIGVNLAVGDTNWNIVVQSLRQPDISIRRRALDVALRLVSKETLKPLMQHLFDFLLAASHDLKRESISKIAKAIDLFSDSELYKLETMVKIFTIAGNCVNDNILHSFIASVGKASQANQVKIATKLYYVVGNNLSQDALVQAAIWCLGEYGHLLSDLPQSDLLPDAFPAKPEPVEPAPAESTDLISILDDFTPEEPKKEVVELITNGTSGGYKKVVNIIETLARHILTCSLSPSSCANGEYLLTCAGKLCHNVPEESARLMRIVCRFKTHSNVELQQRACELEVLYEHNRMNVLVGSDVVNAVHNIDFASLDITANADRVEPSSFQLLEMTPTVSPPLIQPDPVQQKSAQDKLSTLDFMSFDYPAGDSKAKPSDDFGEFAPF